MIQLKSERIGVRLTPRERKQAEKWARKLGVRLSAFIASALSAHVAELEARP